MIPKKERFSDVRFYVAIAAMLAFFAKSFFGKPQRQVNVEQLPETLAGVQISGFQAFLSSLTILVLSVLVVHVWASRNKQIDNI